jgi:hypothetical protein
LPSVHFLKCPLKRSGTLHCTISDSVCLELYDDSVNQAGETVTIKQWISEADVRDKRVLIVDEVNDTRTTLHFCMQTKTAIFNPTQIAIVIHNKLNLKIRAADNKGAEKDNVNIEHFWAGVNGKMTLNHTHDKFQMYGWCIHGMLLILMNTQDALKCVIKVFIIFAAFCFFPVLDSYSYCK